MAERERKQKPAPKERVEEAVEEVAAPCEAGREIEGRARRSARRNRLGARRHAEEFVRNYVQKGGQ